MWLFTVYGFFSVVRDGKKMSIRARKRAHLEELLKRFSTRLKGVKILELPNRDYGYRILVDSVTWSMIAEDLAEEIDWTNFKSEVKQRGGDADYEHVLHRVWAEMF